MQPSPPGRSIVSRAIAHLRYGWFYLWLALFLLWIHPLCIIHFRAGNPDKAAKLRSRFSRYLLIMSGLKLDVSSESVQPNPAIYCANHTSLLDILLLCAALPGPIAFLGKAELANWPIVGVWFRHLDIAVERGNARRSASTLLISSDRLALGISPVIFPEGGIFPDAPKLHPFQGGAAMLSKKSGIPLVPIALPDSHFRMPDGRYQLTGKLCRVVVLSPLIQVDDLRSATRELEKRIGERLGWPIQCVSHCERSSEA